MTREEATKIFRKEIECMSHSKCEDCILEKVCDPMRTTPFDSEYIEAYELAIKALEYDDAKYHEEHGEVVVDKAVWEDAKKALEQEPCEDAISREKVCDYIAEFINHEYSTDAECEMVDFMIEGIQHMPSVTPQKEGD